MKESDVVRLMLKELNSQELTFAIRTHGSAFQMKGTPDIIGCSHGMFFAIEAKRSAKDHASDVQLYVLSKMESAGARVWVSHDPEVKEVIEWISSLDS